MVWTPTRTGTRCHCLSWSAQTDASESLIPTRSSNKLENLQVFAARAHSYPGEPTNHALVLYMRCLMCCFCVWTCRLWRSGVRTLRSTDEGRHGLCHEPSAGRGQQRADQDYVFQEGG